MANLIVSSRQAVLARMRTGVCNKRLDRQFSIAGCPSAHSPGRLVRDRNTIEGSQLAPKFSALSYIAVRRCHDNSDTSLPPYKPLPKKITPAFLRMWWNLSKYMLRSGFFDFNVFKQLNEFQDGFIFTFEFVSKCIAQQTLDEMEAFVSADVMSRLKTNTGIAIALNHVHPFAEKFTPIFSPMDVVFNGRYLEMSVSFVYVPKVMEGNIEEETQRISMLKKYAHIGLYRFFRPFNKGKPIDDWTVTDVQYVTLEDLNKPQKDVE